MNRIKEALKAGKAVHCKTKDEALRLFEIMGWDEAGTDFSDLFYHEYMENTSYIEDDGHWNFCSSAWYRSQGFEVVEFSALARSRLAEALGVDDGQKFLWSKRPESMYRIFDGVRQHFTEGIWCDCCREEDLCKMLAHPEEIKPCPVWSEETIKAARAAELLGFESVSKDSGGDLILCHEGDCTAAGYQDLFPEIQPGQTVKLSEIK